MLGRRSGYDAVADPDEEGPSRWRRLRWPLMVAGLVVLTLAVVVVPMGLRDRVETQAALHAAEYTLVHAHQPENFLRHYTFYDGPDANGSMGLQTYVSEDVALAHSILNVSDGEIEIRPHWAKAGADHTKGELFSVRLEGRHILNSGLFVFDISHMPVGCGMWPAIWLTNEDQWPANGEIDVVEGVNKQDMAATALHTAANCTMASVPNSAMTGAWDISEGVPDKWTGKPTPGRHEARNCFAYAPEQWMNQGCVARDTTSGTFGHGLNRRGGGLFVLEWDPSGDSQPYSGEAGNARMHGGFIRSWAFVPRHSAPRNLKDALERGTTLLPDTWGKPYAYFHLNGQDMPAEAAAHQRDAACSSDHFKDMHLVINTAICGAVAGEKFRTDCPAEFKKYYEEGEDSIITCERYMRNEPGSLVHSKWRIKSVQIYQRTSAE